MPCCSPPRSARSAQPATASGLEPACLTGRRESRPPAPPSSFPCRREAGTTMRTRQAPRVSLLPDTRDHESRITAYTREHECSRFRFAEGASLARRQIRDPPLASERLVDLAPGPTGNNGADWKLRLETTLILETSVSAYNNNDRTPRYAPRRRREITQLAFVEPLTVQPPRRRSEHGASGQPLERSSC